MVRGEKKKIRVWLLNNSKVIQDTSARLQNHVAYLTQVINHAWQRKQSKQKRKKGKKYKAHTLMHCFESILHPLVFYFYSSSLLYPENLNGCCFCPGIYCQKVKRKHELSYKSHKIAFAQVAAKASAVRHEQGKKQQIEESKDHYLHRWVK